MAGQLFAGWPYAGGGVEKDLPGARVKGRGSHPGSLAAPWLRWTIDEAATSDREAARRGARRGGMVPRDVQADRLSAQLGRKSRINPSIVRARQSATHLLAHHARPGGAPAEPSREAMGGVFDPQPTGGADRDDRTRAPVERGRN